MKHLLIALWINHTTDHDMYLRCVYLTSALMIPTGIIGDYPTSLTFIEALKDLSLPIPPIVRSLLLPSPDKEHVVFSVLPFKERFTFSTSPCTVTLNALERPHTCTVGLYLPSNRRISSRNYQHAVSNIRDHSPYIIRAKMGVLIYSLSILLAFLFNSSQGKLSKYAKNIELIEGDFFYET